MVLSSPTSSSRPTFSTAQGGVVHPQWGGVLEGAGQFGGSSRSSLGLVGVGQIGGYVQMGGHVVGVVGGEHQRGGSVVGVGQMGRD